MTTPPHAGLALIPDEGFLAAASPLFEAGLVNALEWCVDIPWGFGPVQIPEWVEPVLDVYSNAGRLYGHGMAFSALSAVRERRQDEWLERLAGELARRRYLHVSEHFGFMSAPGFAPAAPFPLPMSDAGVRIGREALGRLADVVGAPVGLENLAPVMGMRDADEQGDFLEALLAPMDGFLILDLHNLFCQAHNLALSPTALLERLPLSRTKEIHVAGGSLWTAPCDPHRPVRRDTHDGPVPDEVFDLLRTALHLCPAIEAVIFERFPRTLESAEARGELERDFRRLRDVVKDHHV